MTREYDTFVEDPALLPDKQEMDITIRELTPDDRRKKYRSKFVQAYIFHSPDREKDDLLWARFERGPLYDQPFGIRIIEEKGPFEKKLPFGIRR